MDIQSVIENLKRAREIQLEVAKNRLAIDLYETAISAMQELQQYRELEEKELLIKLPCKIGSRVYRIYMDCPKDFKPGYCTDHEGSCENCHHRVPDIIVGEFLPQYITEYGKKVFLTREEAEKALKGACNG